MRKVPHVRRKIKGDYAKSRQQVCLGITKGVLMGKTSTNERTLILPAMSTDAITFLDLRVSSALVGNATACLEVAQVSLPFFFSFF